MGAERAGVFGVSGCRGVDQVRQGPFHAVEQAALAFECMLNGAVDVVGKIVRPARECVLNEPPAEVGVTAADVRDDTVLVERIGTDLRLRDHSPNQPGPELPGPHCGHQ